MRLGFEVVSEVDDGVDGIKSLIAICNHQVGLRIGECTAKKETGEAPEKTKVGDRSEVSALIVCTDCD